MFEKLAKAIKEFVAASIVLLFYIVGTATMLTIMLSTGVFTLKALEVI